MVTAKQIQQWLTAREKQIEREIRAIEEKYGPPAATLIRDELELLRNFKNSLTNEKIKLITSPK